MNRNAGFKHAVSALALVIAAGASTFSYAGWVSSGPGATSATGDFDTGSTLTLSYKPNWTGAGNTNGHTSGQDIFNTSGYCMNSACNYNVVAPWVFTSDETAANGQAFNIDGGFFMGYDPGATRVQIEAFNGSVVDWTQTWTGGPTFTFGGPSGDFLRVVVSGHSYDGLNDTNSGTIHISSVVPEPASLALLGLGLLGLGFGRCKKV